MDLCPGEHGFLIFILNKNVIINEKRITKNYRDSPCFPEKR